MESQKKYLSRKGFKITAMVILMVLILLFIFAKYKHISPLSWNMHSKINQAVFGNEAIEGYDPVAYFKQAKAVKGEKTNSYIWNNATWYFLSPENINLFKNDPDKYAPQFGGYCSFAVSKGFTAKIDPFAWIIIDGRLYLFNDESFKNKWIEDERENLEKDKSNWPGIY
ncbi:MAG: YHS domain-containing (seleno)protein [Ginsengibacter sp.]